MDISKLLNRSRVAQAIVATLFPRIRSRDLREWPALLAEASRHAFDLLEWIGVVAGVVLVAAILRPLASSSAPPVVTFASQFLLSVPLLLIAVGPFFVRRTNRGLDRLLDERDGTTARDSRAGGHDG